MIIIIIPIILIGQRPASSLSIGSGDSSLSGHSGALSLTLGGTDYQQEFRHGRGRRTRGKRERETFVGRIYHH